ncbi:hypothetical protein [Mycobacterium sp. E735]|uniref:hypothetical protein n=1 Tax=Mycobacterium sp. E735 TaxID=1834148 RepID=UPI000A47E001|nr:hypothetical protein [Mycobacterium sp. E735]
MSPPPVITKPQSGGTTSAEARSQTQHAIRATHAILANLGVEMSPSRVSRIVRQYEARVMHNGWTFLDFLTNKLQLSAQQRRRMLADPEMARVTAYLDPTGETAVNHVLRQARRSPVP